MAGRREIRCVGPSYMLADRKSAIQRAVNLFMREVEGLGEDKQVVLDSAPGLELFLNMGAEIRGTYSTESRWFAVVGDTLYEMTSGATFFPLGSLATVSGFVSIIHGRDQLVIVDGSNGYVLNMATNVFAQITSPGWRGSDWVEWIDGYFVFADPGTDQFYISAIDDASNLDALDFSSADAQPDSIITHRVMKRELYLMGAVSIEVWIDTGDADFPFARYNSTPIDVGVTGYRAACLASDTIVWVGRTKRGHGYVYMMQGHQPVRISTQAVEEALSLSSDLSLATMWSYHVKGNEFVGLNAPDLETTWVYDLASKQWHERGERINGVWNRLRTDQVTFFAGTHYATAASVIYRQDTNIYEIAGAPLVRERTWPHLMSASSEPLTYRSLELGCTTGYGGEISLEVSNDGGYTFKSPLLKSLGVVGQWMQRVRWLFLGAARDRVFRLRCSDAVPLTIHQATVDA